jgi:hypothetical protein
MVVHEHTILYTSFIPNTVCQDMVALLLYLITFQSTTNEISYPG